MFGQDLQRAVDVDDEIEPAEHGLVRADRGQAAAGKAVDHEGRNPHRIELAHPGLHGRRDAAGAVHQHHGGKFADALRDAEFAGHGDRRAVGVAGQELLVRNRQRGDGVDLDPGGDLLRDRLRIGLDAGEQYSGTEDRGCGRHAPVRQHPFPPSALLLQVLFLLSGRIDQAGGGLSICRASPSIRPALREPRETGEVMRCGSGRHMAIIPRVPGVALLLVGMTCCRKRSCSRAVLRRLAQGQRPML